MSYGIYPHRGPRGKSGWCALTPKALNAPEQRVEARVMDALDTFDADPSIGAIRHTGDERAFAAGATSKRWPRPRGRHVTERYYPALSTHPEGPKPMIAACFGWSLGRPMRLAMSCRYDWCF